MIQRPLNDFPSWEFYQREPIDGFSGADGDYKIFSICVRQVNERVSEARIDHLGCVLTGVKAVVPAEDMRAGEPEFCRDPDVTYYSKRPSMNLRIRLSLNAEIQSSVEALRLTLTTHGLYRAIWRIEWQ